MKKYIVILAALALAIGGSINLTGCGGEPTGAPTAKPDPIPAPGYTGPEIPLDQQTLEQKTSPGVPPGINTGPEDDPKPAEK